MSRKTTHRPNALVLGCAGFIGRHLIGELRRRRFHVSGVDVAQSDIPCTYGKIDVREINNFKDFDYVFQFAEDVGGTAAILKGDSLRTADTMAINAHIVKTLVLNKYRGKVFFPSSSCVYSRTMLTPYPAGPSTEYGWAKLMCERMYLAAAKEHGLNVYIGRLNNVYGPGDHLEPEKIKSMAALCMQVLMAKRGGEIKIWGSGEQRRAYTYVSDTVKGIINLVDNCASGVPTNISSTFPVSINTLVDLIAGIAGKKVKLAHTGQDCGAYSRIPVVPTMAGWLPRISLPIGITVTLMDIKERLK